MLRAPALKAAGTLYAFATGEDLVVKLPAARVSEFRPALGVVYRTTRIQRFVA